MIWQILRGCYEKFPYVHTYIFNMVYTNVTCVLTIRVNQQQRDEIWFNSEKYYQIICNKINITSQRAKLSVAKKISHPLPLPSKFKILLTVYFPRHQRREFFLSSYRCRALYFSRPVTIAYCRRTNEVKDQIGQWNLKCPNLLQTIQSQKVCKVYKLFSYPKTNKSNTV